MIIIRNILIILGTLALVFGMAGAASVIDGGWVAEVLELGPQSQASRPVYNPATVTKQTRVVYVREYSNFRPPAGAPIYYAPQPSTLCMLGEGSRGPKVANVIYEAHVGACEAIIDRWCVAHDCPQR